MQSQKCTETAHLQVVKVVNFTSCVFTPKKTIVTATELFLLMFHHQIIKSPERS